jgi:hypothetical protein
MLSMLISRRLQEMLWTGTELKKGCFELLEQFFYASNQDFLIFKNMHVLDG